MLLFFPKVRASDRGRPSRNATTRVSVTVLGVPQQSENPPELGSDNSRRADVMESDPVGHAVAFITANDPDGDMLWYKIEGQSSASLCSITYFYFSSVVIREIDVRIMSTLEVTFFFTPLKQMAMLVINLRSKLRATVKCTSLNHSTGKSDPSTLSTLV